MRGEWALLPAPRVVRRRQGRFRVREGVPIVLPDGARRDEFRAALALQEGVRERCGLALPIEGHARTDGIGPHLRLRRDGEAGEGYRLEVSRHLVEVAGGGPAGLRYGVETLLQLVTPAGALPACEIEDAPDLRLRGLMLDVSRGKVPTVACVEGLLDWCVRLKLNTLMLYTEHSFAFRRHPEIGEGSSPFTAEELRHLDAFAAERHVDLVPTLQSLGHMEKILSLRRYADLDESGMGWTLSPSAPGTYALLRDLYDEYLPNFRSSWFNANCDEPWDLGRGRSKRRAETVGRGGVFAAHVRRVRELARARGKRTMIWGDVVHQHPEEVPGLPQDLLLLDWGYEADCDVERVVAFRRAGLEFVVCPGTSSWNALFPRVENSLVNIERWAGSARRHHARGLLCTDWGDGGHYNLLGSSLLAYAWAAQQAWSGEVDPRRFDRAFGRRLFGDASGEAARCYRALGAVHEVGFRVFNASPVQLLFFDDLERAYFLQGAKRAALERGARRLATAHARIRAARAAFGRDGLTWEELDHGAEASRFAFAKGLAALEWLAWRRRPERLGARERRALARRLARLASDQEALLARLQRLWLARSRPSEFEITRRRARGSIRSLRRASRALERGQAPAPPEPAEDYGPGAVVAALRASRERANRR